jgi:hypothetical protein
MKTFTAPIATTVVLGALALVPSTSFAANRCDHPRGVAEERACAKAAESPEALRRFITRTRMIWGLSYADYARDEPAPRAAAPHPDNGIRTASTTGQ